MTLPPSDSLPTKDVSGHSKGSQTHQQAISSSTIRGLQSRRLGKYELLERIGRGGMGEVYKAYERSLDRIVALKILRPEEINNADRLVAEARMMARLGDHYNVAAVYEAGEIDGHLCIAMQYVDGGSAADPVRRGPLDPSQAHQIVEQVARALKHASAKGVVHRDIKPSNILLSREGVVKVVDFGLAREVSLEDETATVSLCGTPAYMAPEQWGGRGVDWRADQYALGVTYYQLLTGRLPFEGGLHEQRQMHLTAEPPLPHEINPTAPPAAGALIGRMMAKTPNQRFTSWDELIHQLRLLQNPPREDQPKPSSPPRRPAPVAVPKRPRARLRVARRALAAGLLVSAAMTIFWLLGAFETLELMTLDWRFRWAAVDSAPSQVAVVLIDQKSKDELAPHGPLSRSEHLGEMLAALQEAEAIGVDLLITEEGVSEEDGQLAFYAQVVPAVFAINLPLRSGAPRWAPLDERIARWALPIDPARLPEAQRLDAPIDAVIAALPQDRVAGHVLLTDDRDGVIRCVPHLIRYQDRVFPSLSLATVMQAIGAGPEDVSLSADRRLKLQGAEGTVLQIPLDRWGQMLIDYSPRPLAHWSLSDLLDAKQTDVFSQSLKGQVVFVGSALDGDHDVDDVPVHHQVPLVEAHALAADTILRQRFVEPATPPAQLLIVLLAPLAMALIAGLLSPTWSLSMFVAVGALYGAGAHLAFEGETRHLLPIAAPAVGAVAAYVLSASLRYRGEELDKRRLASALARYVSPGVLRRVLDEPQDRLFDGRRKELTVVQLRLRQFSQISQKLEPEEAVDLLRPLFAALTEVIFKYEGVVDQFTGEGVRAFFGDPDPQPDHALRAVRCALEMRSAAAEVIRDWSRAGRPNVLTGIGVATGYATVGNVGSPQRMEYTVLGHVVEEAEQNSRARAGQIVVGSRTQTLLEGSVQCSPLDSVSGESQMFEVVSVSS